jgi:heavy metal translocating P-type ATPase
VVIDAGSVTGTLRRAEERLLLPVVVAAIGGGLVAWLAGLRSVADALWAAVTATVIVVVLVGSYATLRRGQVGVDVVALLALIGALALDELLAGAVIGLMVATGEALERFAHRRAQRDLSELLSLAPSVAHRVGDGGLTTVTVDEVRPGDVLLVKPGEVVPVDGVVEREAATLDESVLTGEPLPVDKQVGEPVESGSVNAAGAFHLRAEATAEESAYSGIVRLVEEAGVERARFVRLADRYAAVFVPVTLAVAGVAWLLSGDAVRALAVLVVATPCPLVLAAPVALVSGISRAARRGVIVKDGGALEALARARLVLFDKTGTLTAGRPLVTGVIAAPRGDAAEVLRLAASVEQASPHVLASALVSESAHRDITLARPEQVVEAAGAGVRGVVDGRKVTVGSEAHVLGEAERPPWIRQAIRQALREGWSTVFVGIDGTPAGVVLLGDELRADSARALRALRRAGIERVVMVTGDDLTVAEPIGLGLGIDRVYADRSPAEKVEVVRAESAGAATAVMVGDGVNDAPALAAADLGVALGARGATASSEAADVVLVVDRLDRLALGMRMAQRAQAISRQSVVGGMGLAFVAMGFAAFGFIAPVAGAFLQELIDVAAIASALRVLRTPSWDTEAAAVPDSWAWQLSEEHAELRDLLDRLRGLAGRLDDLPTEEALSELRRASAAIRDEVVSHERTDELDIYPDVEKRLGGDDPLAAMSRTHQEIFHLASMLERLVEQADTEITAADRSEARRLLYALDAILRLHYAQEEELFSVLAPDHTPS